MPNINNSKLKKFLEGQNDQNLWSDLPDAHAEVVGGGQSSLIPNIEPLIGGAMNLYSLSSKTLPNIHSD
ncbi:MAG: hypothetical protein F6K09_11395 [Merismopedia sp. SIO2A8]|nr:hypothetical protein [Merismopedia sp. SIO2A8]